MVQNMTDKNTDFLIIDTTTMKMEHFKGVTCLYCLKEEVKDKLNDL